MSQEDLSGIRMWQLDKAHTSLDFVARHMMVANVRGTFRAFDAEIKLDPNNLERGEIIFTISAASVDTQQPERDNHLRSPDFFNAEKFPNIVFKSKKISIRGEDATITGDLTIRDVTKEIQVNGQISGPIKDPYGNLRIGFEGAFSLNRKDYGLNWNMLLEGGGLLVGDNIRVQIFAEAFTK